MLTEQEIRAIASTIVQRAKATARVDQGTLKRSISYTISGGVVTFRQIYYGDYKDNSQLEKLARQLMPNGVEYKIELTNESGGTVEISRTKSGRKSQRSVLQNIIKNNSPKIRALIARTLLKKKNNGTQE